MQTTSYLIRSRCCWCFILQTVAAGPGLCINAKTAIAFIGAIISSILSLAILCACYLCLGKYMLQSVIFLAVHKRQLRVLDFYTELLTVLQNSCYSLLTWLMAQTTVGARLYWLPVIFAWTWFMASQHHWSTTTIAMATYGFNLLATYFFGPTMANCMLLRLLPQKPLWYLTCARLYGSDNWYGLFWYGCLLLCQMSGWHCALPVCQCLSATIALCLTSPYAMPWRYLWIALCLWKPCWTRSRRANAGRRGQRKKTPAILSLIHI